MKLREERVLWHPESPGMRVRVRVWRWSRREFATLGQVLRSYRAPTEEPEHGA